MARRRVVTAREQHEMLRPWFRHAADRADLRWERDGSGDWVLIGRNPDGNPVALSTERAPTPRTSSRGTYVGGMGKPDDDEGNDDFEWDDDDVFDPAPAGTWTPPKYDEDADYGPTGGLYGDHRERYREDLYHNHLADLDDQELIDAYEHQRKKPDFKGSDLEDTMWTAFGNRIEEHDEREDTDPDARDWGWHPAILNYFNKVHGCSEHLWTPPDQHEPHGNFGEHPQGWDPDEGQDPFDPRLIGASRTEHDDWGDEDDGWIQEPPAVADYAQRDNGLKWSYDYSDPDYGPSYIGEHPSGDSMRPTYEVSGPHDDGHPKGPYSVLWSQPGYSGGRPEDGHPGGEFHTPDGGMTRHQSPQEAMDWAEQHNALHETRAPVSAQEAVNKLTGVPWTPDMQEMLDQAQGWNPDENPGSDDPRIKGASKEARP